MKSWVWWVFGLGAAGAAAAALSSSSSSSTPTKVDPPKKSEPPKEGKTVFPKSKLEGKKGDPAIEDELDRMNAWLQSQGIDTSRMSSRELTRLPKATLVDYAIPPDELWSNILPAARALLRIREAMGKPMTWRGYRPPWYNKAVGGAPASSHQEFSGIDAYVAGGNAEDRRRLGLLTAQLWLEGGPMGFGAYGAPTPSNVHVDFPTSLWEKISGLKPRRAYREADHYIAKAKAIA